MFLEKNNFKVDYLEVLDAEDLCEVSESSKKAIVAVAVKYNGIRLIDNIVFLYSHLSLRASSG